VSEIARPCDFVLWFLSEPKEDFGTLAPWSFEGSPPVIDNPTWCGAATTIFVRGTWRPPSFVEKLLSGTRDQGDRGDSVSPGKT